MNDMLVYPVGSTEALGYAEKMLKAKGVPLVDHPTPEITHLLLDVPSFGPDGKLRSGTDPVSVLERVPPDATIVGGNLMHPALTGCKTLDLLQDAQYLAENAMITADCALQAAAPHMKATFRDSPVLVIGWGRIGKCLSQLLQGLGAPVTIAARKTADRAMIAALGFQTADTLDLTGILPKCRVLFNTAPERVLNAEQLALCRDCVKIDLASRQGLSGNDVVWARGLPGVYAPESSGKRIAEAFLRLYREGTL